MILTKQARASSPSIPTRMLRDSFLGARYTGEQTEFLLWAPTFEKVTLRLFTAGSEAEAADPYRVIRMEKEDNGLYSVIIPGDLNGVYYDYILTDAKGKEDRASDPWALACGVNGKRSMVIDLRATDPDGWAEDIRPKSKMPSPVIWETHVRDFSADPHSGVRPEWRGRYLGFTEKDTTLNSDGKWPTCVNYLKQLGITHVQLQPIADYVTVDERTCDKYNWGYDPEHYNIPEGSYSTDPFHGEIRIRECKQMIQSLHQAGIGVVLDVVYNHTYYSKWSALARTAPGMYYRHRPDGRFYNASGCGCETASERWPFQNFMIQSVLYWAKEYHVDGFRFDLMAIHDVDTMNLIRRELDRIPGGKQILMYGEPWSALPTSIEAPAVSADKAHVTLLDDRVGVFCDATRDTVAGPAFDPWTGNYCAGRMQDWMVRSVQSAVCGWSNPSLDHYMNSPTQCVHYDSAHDNYTLWDRMVMQRDSRDFDGRHPHAEARQRVVAGIILSCCGLAFLHGGEEFLRTKHGNENTYNGPADENMLRWSLTVRNSGMVDWYRGLIQLHRQMAHTGAIGMDSVSRISFIDMRDGAVAFTVPARRGSGYHAFTVCYNPLHHELDLDLPAGKWHLICDGLRSDLRGVACRVCEGKFIVPQTSVLIFGR